MSTPEDQQQQQDEEIEKLETGSGDTTSDKLPEAPVIRGPLKPIAEYTPLEIFAGTLGTAAFVLGFLNMIFTGGIIIVVSGAFAMITGPYFYWQRNRLTDIKTFKEVTEVVQNQIDMLSTNNKELEGKIVSLESTNQRLQQLDKTFKEISALGDKTIEAFAEMLEQQRQNVTDQGYGLVGQVLSLMMDLIETADTDKDYIFDDNEIDHFIEQLRLIQGITIYEDRIKDELVGQDLNKCFDEIMKLHDDECPKDKMLFDVHAA